MEENPLKAFAESFSRNNQFVLRAGYNGWVIDTQRELFNPPKAILITRNHRWTFCINMFTCVGFHRNSCQFPWRNSVYKTLEKSFIEVWNWKERKALTKFPDWRKLFVKVWVFWSMSFSKFHSQLTFPKLYRVSKCSKLHRHGCISGILIFMLFSQLMPIQTSHVLTIKGNIEIFLVNEKEDFGDIQLWLLIWTPLRKSYVEVKRNEQVWTRTMMKRACSLET